MRNIYYLILLVAIGVVVYFMIPKSPFALDDYGQIVRNISVHRIQNIPLFFTQSIAFPGQGQSLLTYYYKPFLYTFYSFLYALGNGSSFPFHSFQLALYILNALLVFLLFNKFFSKNMSFLLSIIFLLHPANNEVVSYIASLQDTLFLFFGITALNLLTLKDTKKLLTVISVSILILFSIFSKETGLLFLTISIVYLIIFKTNLVKYYLVSFIFSGLIYLGLKLLALNHVILVLLSTPIQQMPFKDRIIIIPKIIYFYLKELLFPSMYFPDVKLLQNTNIITSIGPLLAIILILILIVFIGIFIKHYYSSYFSIFIFFTTWFVIGISFHSQIIPLDVPIATRWLYFPIVGALGMVGVVLSIIKSWTIKIKYKRMLLIAYIIYVSLLVFEIEAEQLSYLRLNPQNKIINSLNN